jgi:hypothetical protein
VGTFIRTEPEKSYRNIAIDLSFISKGCQSLQLRDGSIYVGGYSRV